MGQRQAAAGQCTQKSQLTLAFRALPCRAVGRRETVQNDSQSQELDDRYTLSILHTGGGRSGPWHKVTVQAERAPTALAQTAWWRFPSLSHTSVSSVVSLQAAAALHEICRAVLRSVLLAPNSVGDADAFDRLLNQNPDGTSILDAYLFKPEARTGVSKSFAVDKGLLTAVWSQDSGVQVSTYLGTHTRACADVCVASTELESVSLCVRVFVVYGADQASGLCAPRSMWRGHACVRVPRSHPADSTA